MTWSDHEDEGSGPAIAAENIDAVAGSAGLELQGSERQIARAKMYLAEVLRGAARRAPRRKALTPSEIRKVEALHDRFDALLRSYQRAANPPPMLPQSTYDSGKTVTPWERWSYRLRFQEAGKSDTLNCAVIGELLAIYEVLYGRRVVAEDPARQCSPQTAFLKAAFAVIREAVRPDTALIAPWYYQVPSVSTLNKRIDRLRENEMRFADRRIREFVDKG